MRIEAGIFIRGAIVATVICTALTPPGFSAENVTLGEELPERLKSRKSLYEGGIESAVAPVKARYRRDLEMLIAGYTRARDLDSSLAVSEELKAHDGAGDSTGEAKVEPRKLVDLRLRYTEELQRVQAPIRERYERDLQVMIKDFTHSRELEAAVAVRSELDRLRLMQQSTDPDGLSVWIQNHILTWKGQNGYVEISFDQRMATVSADGREIMERSYTIQGEDTVEFEWSPNETNTFILSKDRNSFVRKSSNGSANHGGEVKRR